MSNYKISWKKELPILLIVIAPIIALLALWSQLPESLPIHWNFQGEVDGYGKKWATPLINIGIYLALLFIPFIDPRMRNYQIFSDTYFKIRILFAVFMSVILGISMAIGLGYESSINQFVDFAKLLPILICTLFVLLGNYMGNIRPNWFLGIRTPWTLDSETVWKKTHRLAGKLWFWGGILGIVLMFLLPVMIAKSLVFGGIILLSIVPVIYSFVIYRGLKLSK